MRLERVHESHELHGLRLNPARIRPERSPAELESTGLRQPPRASSFEEIVVHHATSDYGHETRDGGAGSVDRRQPHAADPAPPGAPAPSTLDSTQSKCCPPPLTSDDVRRQRWEARALLWRASLLKAVRCCGAQGMVERLDDGSTAERQHVTIRRYSSSESRVAGVGGLMSCGSVWACPRCSALVAFERARDLARVFERCKSLRGRAFLLTLTLRHSRADDLASLWQLLSAGWRAAFGTRSWTGSDATATRGRRIGDRERFGVGGLVRVVEATVSRPGEGSGWHVHIHCVVFCIGGLTSGLCEEWAGSLADAGVEAPIDSAWLSMQLFFCRVIRRWSVGVEGAGGAPVLGAACDIRPIDLEEDQFLSRYLAKSTYSAALEVSAGQPVKIAHNDRMAPFELLAELVAVGPSFGVRTPKSWSIAEAGEGFGIVDHSTGETEQISSPGLWRLWHEWEVASKGRRQIMWSRVRRDDGQASHFWNELMDARGKLAEDEEVVRRSAYGEFVASIPISVWTGHLVWRPNEISQLVSAASIGDEEFRRVSELLGIENDQ